MRKIMSNLKYLINTYLVLIAICMYSGNSVSQTLEVIADYPLIDDLVDDTGNNNDVFLEGNPTFPTLPSTGVSLCSNGIYIIDADGQNIETPIMPTFDIRNFSMEVEFNVTQLPGVINSRTRMPIIMGSRFARWLGIYIDSSGVMGFKFNNFSTNYRWSNTSISGIGNWHSTKITYYNGHVELFLDDQLIMTDDVGPLVTFQNTFNFSVTDFSEGNPFYGCIRNLIISTSPDLLFQNGFE